MAEPRKGEREQDRPHAHRDRGLVSEGPHKGRNRGADTPHDPDSARLERSEGFEPDRDGTSS